MIWFNIVKALEENIRRNNWNTARSEALLQKAIYSEFTDWR